MDPGSSSRDLGVYVHVPFCERVCPYCDFAVVGVGRLGRARETAYVDALLRELELWLERHAALLGGRALETVYLGGGTPSLLSPGSVARILAALRSAFAGAPSEVTLEVNPEGIGKDTARALCEAGVTRLSLGAQSLHDATLRRLGRGHAAAQARAGLHACLAAGAASVSADLIYGAPGQSCAELLADVDELIGAGVPHVSAYALTLEPGTPFARARERGRLALPGEDAVVEMARALWDRLGAAGLERYEISSAARAGHRSRHNQRYWLRRDVLGLGPSAAGLLGERRLANAREPARWAAAIAAGELARDVDQPLDADAQRRETLYLGLRRLEGVDREAFARRFGAPPERWLAPELAELRALGLLGEVDGRLLLSARGLLFADEVFLRLVEDPASARASGG
jgi:oxygen-independent coproporphyrinogen-3 oxidase